MNTGTLPPTQASPKLVLSAKATWSKPPVKAIVAGLCLAVSIPPAGWWPFAFAGIALLDNLIGGQRWQTRFARTWLVAAIWLYPTMLWMWDLTPPGYVAAGGLFAAYFATAVALVPDNKMRLFALPAAFALAELVRWYWPFGGVPLANLALSQANGPLAGSARLFGPLTVVVLLVVGGQALHQAVRANWKSAGVGTAVIVGFILAGFLHPSAGVVRTVDVALVQGGGAQRTRASSEQTPVVLARHVEASRYLEPGQVDLVVWPENVVNPNEKLLADDASNIVKQVAAATEASLLAGWFFPVSDTRTVNYHSTVTPEGNEIDRYDKVRTVPFGEFVPLRPIVELFSDEVPARDLAPGTVEPVLDTPVGPVGVAISWEGYFERRSRDAIHNGAQLLANPTNGASYWLTQVQTQQVASNRLRALETDRWVLQVAPTGISAVIDPRGSVLQKTEISERATLTHQVEMREGRTLASLVGLWPILLFSLVSLGLANCENLSRLVNKSRTGPHQPNR